MLIYSLLAIQYSSLCCYIATYDEADNNNNNNNNIIILNYFKTPMKLMSLVSLLVGRADVL